MVRFIVAVLLITFSLNNIAEAQEKIILIQGANSESLVKKDVWGKDKRSSTDFLFATHTHNNLYIYPHKYIENLQITISDDKGNIISSISTSLVPNEPISICLDNIKRGEYCIVLELYDCYYYGYFEIIQ